MTTFRIEMPWRYWTIADGSLDNEFAIVTEANGHEAGRQASVIRAAAWSQVSEAMEGLDLEARTDLASSDEPVAVELSEAQWRYIIDVLRTWQAVESAGESVPTDPLEPKIIAVIERELGSL
jgi:hypothetical protein